MPQSTPHVPPQVPVLPALDTAPTGRRIVAIWFPHWLSEIVMPAEKRDAPFVLAEHQRGTQRLAAVNIAAEACGLHTGMALADARALVPDMHIEMLDPARGEPRSINAPAGCVATPHGSVLTRIPTATACCST
jgi:hypothetical protein